LLKQSDDIFKALDDLANNEEESKNFTIKNIQQDLFSQWLNGFKLENPPDYFKNEADNVDLVCNVLNEC
jgi:hypothetical protein